MNKFVVYTAIVGNYDEINQPKLVDDRFDYVLFSNDISQERVGVWQVRNIPYFNEDKTRIARWVKTHPEELLKDYDASLWMDGSLIVRTKYVYDRFVELYSSNVYVSSMWHDQRDCVYDEAVEVVILGLEHEKVVIDWLRRLKKDKYPEHNGLFETCVLYRRHLNYRIIELDNLWWKCINSFSRRDQLSFNYSLWKKGIECPFFFLPKENARNSIHIVCTTDHVGVSKPWRSFSINKKDDVLLYYYTNAGNTKIDKCRLKHMYNIATSTFIPHIIIYIYGQYYRMKNKIRDLKRKLKKIIR